MIAQSNAGSPGKGPSVSLILLSYNNAAYLDEALKGAFSQTYDNLQIILADDCSTDESYAILKAAAKRYSGPHELVLNRNNKNLGIAGNLNRVMELAAGSVIILAAGDDISHPRRVELIAAKFSDDVAVKAVVSSYFIIDEHGRQIGEVALPKDFDTLCTLDSVAKDGGLLALGAAFAYHRDCLVVPGPIPKEILCEDCFLPMRALMMGKIAFVSEPLVRYRKHGTSSTAVGYFKLPDNIIAHQQALLLDLDTCYERGLIGDGIYQGTRRIIARYPPHVRRLLKLQARSRMAARLYALFYQRERTMARLRRWLMVSS